MPLLLLLVPYILGILLADHFIIPDWTLYVGYILAVFIIEFWGNRWLLSTLAISLVMIGFGYMLATMLRPTCNITDGEIIEAQVSIDDIPEQREGYRLSHGRIIEWRGDTVSEKSNYAVLLWIRHDSVREGDVVHLHTRFSERMSRHDNYDRLLRNRGFVGGLSVDNWGVVAIYHDVEQSLQNRAVRKLERYMTDTTTHSTAESMVVGSRRLEPRHLRESYSRTGLSHLMALSGLHLGIVVMVITLLLVPIILMRHGHRIHNIVVIVVMWIYVIMCGASASLVRAALMFSFVQIALVSSRRYNSLNALAAALFTMLIFRPGYLYDISFQLSAMAVMGILVWGVPLIRRVARQSSILRPLLTTFIIGATATLWTMPIVSSSFGTIPYIGVAVTPIAMITSYVIICSGIFTLILPHPLSLPFGWCMEQAAYLQNSFVEWVAQWSWIAIDYRLSMVGVATIYAIFLLITIVVWSMSEKK